MFGFNNALRFCTALLPRQHIFLLSHMRAYTSLFGHIMGSNPAICGYYEMHIGYYSWKSLIRQKLLYFENEDIKPHFCYMFDKVLHDDHHVATKILNRRQSKVIFSLRHPDETIPSILKLYRKIDPEHDFNSQTFATAYYVKRLETLEQMAMSLRHPFYYLDAETLVENPVDCLSSLSQWLRLETPLSPHYAVQRKTSQQRYGDTSGRLDAGAIVKHDQGRDDNQLDPDNRDRAIRSYEKARQLLIERSSSHSVIA